MSQSFISITKKKNFNFIIASDNLNSITTPKVWTT